MKKVIEGIPTTVNDLFAATLDWEVADAAFVSSRIEPWVKKKIILFIGEEEPSLVQFICKRVSERIDARFEG